MGDDDDFFTRLGGRDDTSQNRLRNAPHDNDDVPMAVPPLFEEDEEETPLEQLIRHWMKERHAPDVPPSRRTCSLDFSIIYGYRISLTGACSCRA